MWRPIEEAPKLDRVIVGRATVKINRACFLPGYSGEAYWSDETDAWCFTSIVTGDPEPYDGPTHFMPLPPPPETSE